MGKVLQGHASLFFGCGVRTCKNAGIYSDILFIKRNWLDLVAFDFSSIFKRSHCMFIPISPGSFSGGSAGIHGRVLAVPNLIRSEIRGVPKII